MASYLQNWTGGVESARKLQEQGRPLRYAASAKYREIGLEPGDVLYITYLEDRRLHLIGRLPVGKVLSRRALVRRRQQKDLGDWPWWAEAPPGTGDPFVFDMMVPDDVVRDLRFERKSGQITRLHPARDGALNGQALQAIRRLTPESAALLSSLRDLEPSAPSSGPNRRISAPERRAIERRAMAVATHHYVGLGWTVEDVSGDHPYDLVCLRDDRELHVEVKGRTGTAFSVELTTNELTHARANQPEVALAVVDEIKLKRAKRPVATGGTLRLFEPWTVDDDALEPLRYNYRLP
jgi:hypothetical protein